MLTGGHVPAILAAFGLGDDGRLSDGPVASGRVGAIWRLDTGLGSWAVKEVRSVRPDDRAELLDGAAFQEAAHAAGIRVPAVHRSVDGAVIARVGDTEARVLEWVDLEPVDLLLDPAAVGELVARLHRLPFAGATGLDPWYAAPVGEAAWRSTIDALRAARAPFADELAALVPELVALEAYLGGEPRTLRTCHRDLWADNLRRTTGGGLCVFDFDDAGLADPGQELGAVLIEYAGWDRGRAASIRAAYAEAGGPGRVERPQDFAMPIAQLGHITQEGCRRWLAATDDAARIDNEGWVRETIDRPVTRSLVESLLD